MRWLSKESDREWRSDGEEKRAGVREEERSK